MAYQQDVFAPVVLQVGMRKRTMTIVAELDSLNDDREEYLCTKPSPKKQKGRDFSAPV